MSRFLSLYGVRVREEGCEKSASGATTQASSNAELLSGRSERRCGAHIHANRGLYALSSSNGSKNLKRSSGVLPPGPSKYTSKTVYQLIEQRAFLHPLGGAKMAHEFLIVAINQGVLFLHAHTLGSAWDRGPVSVSVSGYRFRFPVSESVSVTPSQS